MFKEKQYNSLSSFSPYSIRQLRSLKIWLHRNDDDRKSFDNDKRQGPDDWVSDPEQGQQISDSGLRLSAWQEQLDDNPFGCFFTKWRIEIMPNGGVLGASVPFCFSALLEEKGAWNRREVHHGILPNPRWRRDRENRPRRKLPETKD